MEKSQIFGLFIGLIISGIIFYGIFVLASAYCEKERKDKWQKVDLVGKRTNGEISKRYFKANTNYCDYNYFVQNKLYTGSSGCVNDCKIGETFLVVYDSTNPKDHYIKFIEPIYDEKNEVVQTCCEVVQENDYYLRLRYTIADQIYLKFQRVKELDKNFILGQKFNFYYYRNEQSIGYTDFSKCQP